MEHRLLGHSALRVSAIGLGCMSMSGTYGKSDDAASIAVIHSALDQGIGFLDSSDMYGWGHNEELIHRALAGRRHGVVLATKFGQVRSPDGGGNLVDGSAGYVRRACDASLKRLGVDTIDLYYQHRVDPKVPIEETVGAMARLREDGKTRGLGLCETAPATLRRAHAVHPIAALQMEYSLAYRQPAEDALAVCRELATGPEPARGRRRARRRHPGRRPPASASTLPGREPRAQRAARAAPGRDRAGQGRDSRSAGARVAAGPGSGHRADSWHEAARPPQGERR